MRKPITEIHPDVKEWAVFQIPRPKPQKPIYLVTWVRDGKYTDGHPLMAEHATVTTTSIGRDILKTGLAPRSNYGFTGRFHSAEDAVKSLLPSISHIANAIKLAASPGWNAAEAALANQQP